MTIREWIATNPTMVIDEIFSNYGDSHFETEEVLDEEIVEVYYSENTNLVEIEI